MQNDINVSSWLASCVALFNSVYEEAVSLPVLRFFVAVLLFAVCVSLAAWLVRRGSRQRLT